MAEPREARSLRHSPWAGAVSGRLGFDKVLQQFAAGGVVLVWDPEREAEGDVICAGAKLRAETFAFILRALRPRAPRAARDPSAPGAR
jgi:hypothetical protein